MSNQDTADIDTKMLVADIMRRWPATVDVFIAQQMACPGCPMAPFMSLEEAAQSYGMDPRALVADLNARRAG